MRTGKILLSACLLLSFSPGVSAQRQKPQRSRSSVRLSTSEPSVYITFVRFGKRDPVHTGESNEGVWLLLHNNTRWQLVLDAYGVGGYAFATGKEREVGLFYGVEEVPKSIEIKVYTYTPPLVLPPSAEEKTAERQPLPPPVAVGEEKNCDPPYRNFCHVCSTVKLAPGKSLLFSLPREAICKNLKIFVVYSYDWEGRDGYMGDEPEHRVYFYGSMLHESATLYRHRLSNKRLQRTRQ